jgi:microcystin-dependent protein
VLQIAQNQALFSQIGAAFGGDGVTTFALPDLRGRSPIHAGGVAPQVGDKGGLEMVSLTADELPSHTHVVQAGGSATTSKPQTGYWAENGNAATAPYNTTVAGSAMAAGAVTMAGAGAAHENMQPFLALNFMIAVEGGFTTTAEAYIGEVRPFAGAVPLLDWAPCNGALLPLRTNTALWTVIGNTYGGDGGQETVGVPNLLDRLALGAGQGPGLTNRPLGSSGGVNSVTLTLAELAQHTHAAACNPGAGDAYGPTGAYWASTSGSLNYAAAGSDTMAPGVFQATGGGGPHENRQPCVAMTYAIAVTGIYPKPG